MDELELTALTPESSLNFIRVKKREKLPIHVASIHRSLHQAARDGDVRVMQYLLDRLENNILRKINQLDEDKLSPLHYAARYNFYEMVVLLAESGADINIRGEDSLTPLHFAARYKKTRALKLIGSDEKLSTEEKEENNLQEPQQENAENSGSSAGSTAPTSPTNHENPNFYRRFKNFAVQNPIGQYIHKRPMIYRGMFGDSKDATRSPGSGDGFSISSSVILYLAWKGADVNSRDDFELTPLHYAAMRENEVAARELLQCHGILSEARDRQGITAIHLAAIHNSISVAHLLINAGVNIRCTDDTLATPLHRACMEGNMEIVCMLLEAAENLGGWVTVSQMISDLDYSGNTPLHLAADNTHAIIVKILIAKGADVNAARDGFVFPLHLAAIVGNVDIIQELIDNNARVDCLNSFQETPLHKACEFNHPSAIELLLEKGAKLERRDQNNCTPLLIAANKGHVGAIESLIQHEADITAVDKNDKSAIYWTAEGNNLDALTALLVDARAKDLIDRTDRYGNSPLHIAAGKGYLPIVQCLIENGATIDLKNEEEQTALHVAAFNGHAKVVRNLLLRCKALVNSEDEDSNSPLHLAATSGKDKVICILLDAGANLDARNSNQWSALDCASAKGWLRTVRCLIGAGSVIEPRETVKVTPLHLAASKGHVDVIKYLLSKGALVGRRDDQGRNALELSILHSHRDVAMAIVNSEQWCEALRNYSISYQTGARRTPLRYLICKMPDVAERVFDRCVSTNHYPTQHAFYKITFNYEFLDDTYILQNEATEVEDVKASKSSIFDEDCHIKPQAAQYTDDATVVKKNHPLMIMVFTKRQKLLGHPLCISLVQMKWLGFGRYVYYFNLAFYILFLSFLTGYVLVLPHPNIEEENLPLPQAHLLTNTSSESFENTTCIADHMQSRHAFTSVGKIIVLALCSVSLLKECFQIYQLRWRYPSVENFIEWLCYTSGLLLVIDVSRCASISGEREIWQWELGAFSVFLAWLNLVMFVRKFPFLGIYVVMMTDVITTFFKVFIVFFLLIIGFGLSFSILFYNQEPMKNTGMTLLRTSVMMLGEFNYDDMFEEDALKFPVPSYIIFVAFLIIMPIITMNLLVGLAVDDIKGVQEQAGLKRLAMQVELVLNVESILPEFLRRRCIMGQHEVFPNAKTRSLTILKLLHHDFVKKEMEHMVKTAGKSEKVQDGNKVEEQQEAILSRVSNIEIMLSDLQAENRRLRSLLLAAMRDRNFQMIDDDDETASVIES